MKAVARLLDRMSVAMKLALGASLLVAVLGGGATVLSAVRTYDFLDREGVAHLSAQAQLARGMIASYHESLTSNARRLLDTFAGRFEGGFSLHPQAEIVVNGVATPTLAVGGKPLNLDLQEVDRYTRLTGAVATVFARKGEDFVRVATSLRNDKGERVMGTFLGKEHSAYAALLAGQEYYGKTALFGRDYMTGYRPILGAQREVLGALFVGVDFTDGLAGLKREILKIKLGDSGYFFALDARPGKTYGMATIHPVKEGAILAAARDANGREVIKDMLEKKQGVIRYPWLDEELGETAAREKIAVLEHVPEWHWVVGANAYADEMTAPGRALLGLAFFSGIVALAALCVLLFVLSSRMIGRPLAQVIGLFQAIGAGDYANRIETGRADEIGQLLAALASMQSNLRERIERDRASAAESLRIRNALDKASTSMMVADNEGHIIYMNEAVTQMLRAAEADLCRELPHFRADALLGHSFDEFHKNPAYQRGLLANLRGAHTAQIRVGGHTFRLVANPVLNSQGERLGSVVEWADRTAEVQAEEELAGLLEAAVRGDFGRRLQLEGKTGFFRQLAEGMNRLADIVSTGLSDVARVLDAVARGDLTQRVEADYAGTFGQLKEDTNATVARLREVVGRIQEAAGAINTAAGEIASGNADLSSRTEAQASSLQETASSMEELNATVGQNAQTARQAAELAQGSNDTATRGGVLVKGVVDAMGAIQESSRKIADIIGVIDSIAFQTNILALNAAVEAARAGEQGRGFAVVASEVRSLAQRSAQAAKEIKGLIVASVDQVEHGAGQVREAGDTIDEVVTRFQLVSGLLGEIAGATREQSAGIEQVTQAVSQMDEATQQNAALVEQAAAAAESLEEQAKALAGAVAMFRLDPANPPSSGASSKSMPPSRLPQLIPNKLVGSRLASDSSDDEREAS